MTGLGGDNEMNLLTGGGRIPVGKPQIVRLNPNNAPTNPLIAPGSLPPAFLGHHPFAPMSMIPPSEETSIVEVRLMGAS